jgi:acyl-coenzyme A synthetase/AMP-(fatty) acid ligase
MTEVAETACNVASAWIDAAIASNRGDRHAFAYGDKRYSYQDVAALMNRTANMLRRLGVQPGARVLLLLPGSPALVASVLGAMRIGAVPIVGVALANPQAAQLCIDAAGPSAAVVHQDALAAAASALAGVPAQDAVVVVGSATQGRKSFIDEIRSESSWSAAERVDKNAPALAIWADSSLQVLSHAELLAMVGGAAAPAAHASAVAPFMNMLQAFSKAEAATLP